MTNSFDFGFAVATAADLPQRLAQAVQHLQRGEPGLALHLLDEVLRRAPGQPQALQLRSLAQGMGAKAAPSNAEPVLQCVRDSHAAWLAGDAQSALEHLDRALGLDPVQADLLLTQKGMILLAQGDWARGWPLFESRLKSGGATWRPLHRSFGQPLWRGSEALEGRRILVHNEYGLGDAILLARFVREVAARGAQVVLEVQPALIELMQGLSGASQILPCGSCTEFDFHCPMFSLPAALALRPESIPDAGGYLRSDPARAAAWRARLGERRRPRVGLAWSGEADSPIDPWRSISLERLAAALPEGIDYLSLQQQVRDTDQTALHARPALRHFGSALHSMADTAALCDQVDLVVSVDTSVAHLAGALGKPVWILLPNPPPDFRYLLAGDKTPWYDSARLLRQGPDRRWEPVLERLRTELAAWAAGPQPACLSASEVNESAKNSSGGNPAWAE